MTDTLIIEQVDAVAWVTLNRPETKNALDRELVGALGPAMERLAENGAVRVIVITGAGGAFCSGADLKAAMSDPGAMARIEQALDSYHRVIRAIVRAPKPVLAMVDGPAVGFGCDLALACDLRLLSDKAYLQEKFVRIGLMPDGGGSLWLTRMVGIGRALELLLTGDAVEASRAYELGLANRVMPVEALRPYTDNLAQRLAKGPPLAHAAIKQAVRASVAGNIDDALTRERKGQLRCLKSGDFSEGVMAWMEKREPLFKGQ